MSRLIDADKLRLVKCGELDNGKPINCVYEWAIKDAPTVEAIPIEWIVNWLTRQTVPATHTCDDYEAVEMVLNDWEEENDR